MRGTFKLKNFFRKNLNLITSLSLVVMLSVAIVFTSIAIFNTSTKATGTLRFGSGIEANVKNLNIKDVSVSSANLSLMVSGYNSEKFTTPKALDSTVFYNINHNDVFYIENPVISPAKNTKPYFLRAKWQIKIGDTEYAEKDLEKINIHSLPQFNSHYWTQGDDGYYYNTLYDNSQFLQDATDLNINQNDKNTVSQDIIFFSDLNSKITINSYSNYDYNNNSKIDISILLELIEADETYANSEWDLVRSLPTLTAEEAVLLSDDILDKFAASNEMVLNIYMAANSDDFGEDILFGTPPSLQTTALIYFKAQFGINANGTINIPYETLKNITETEINNYSPTETQQIYFDYFKNDIKSNLIKTSNYSLIGVNSDNLELFLPNYLKVSDVNYLNYLARVAIYLTCDGLIYPYDLISQSDISGEYVNLKISTVRLVNTNTQNVVLDDYINLGDYAFSYAMDIRAVSLWVQIHNVDDIDSIVSDLNNYSSLEEYSNANGLSKFKQSIETLKHLLQGTTSDTEVLLLSDIYTQYNLVNIKLNNTMTELPANTFLYSSLLQKIIIPENVTHIQMLALAFCDSLERVDILNENVVCELLCVGFCQSLKGLFIPRNATGGFTLIYMVEEDLESAANFTNNLLSCFGFGMFDDSIITYSNLEYIYIPSKTVITEDLIEDILSIPTLEYITIGALNETYVTIDNCVYSKDGQVVGIPKASVSIYEDEVYEFPEGTTEIKDEFFSDNKKIKKVIIPDSVVKIGQRAFYESSIEEIIIGENSKLNKIGYECFYGSNLTSFICNNKISYGNYCFNNCGQLKEISIVVKNNSYGSFEISKSSSLKSLYITVSSESTEYDYSLEIEDCINLKSLTLLNGKLSKLENTPKLETVTVDDIYIYYNYSGSSSSRYYTYNGVTFKNLSFLQTVTISSCEEIPFEFFSGCTNLENVYIENATQIAPLAFYNCKKLTSINLPSSIKYINDYAFSYCGLTNLTLPTELVYIGSKAFLNNKNLQTVILNEKFKALESDSFKGCNSLSTIKMEGNGKYLYTNANYIYSKIESNFYIPDQGVSESFWVYDGNGNLSQYNYGRGIKREYTVNKIVYTPISSFEDAETEAVIAESTSVTFVDFIDFLCYLVYNADTGITNLDVKFEGSYLQYEDKYYSLDDVKLNSYHNILNYKHYKLMKENFPNLKSMTLDGEEWNGILWQDNTIVFYPFYKTDTTYTLPSDVTMILPDCGLFYNEYLQEIKVDENSKNFISIDNIIYSKSLTVEDFLDELNLPEYAKNYIIENPNIMVKNSKYYTQTYVYIPCFVKDAYVDVKKENVDYLIFMDSYIETLTINNARKVNINTLNSRKEYQIEKRNGLLGIKNDQLNLKYIKSLTNNTRIEINNSNNVFLNMMSGEDDPLRYNSDLDTDFYIYNTEQTEELDYNNYAEHFSTGASLLVLNKNQYAYPDYNKHYKSVYKYYKNQD